ncbi:MAG TPA: HNH endonuclease signature motif containing protein, partial [Bdellovibrio sp.]|nr:HNH endonuclease signature motif containing protein [Bdellovibrio sp.]
MNDLKKLKNSELEFQLKNLVAKERKLLHLILEHIKEVDIRKLFLDRAYSSLYEYMVKELGYSGSAAMRRIEAAKLLREIPSMSEKIQKGSLNLSQIGELSRAVKEKEKSCGEKISSAQKIELVDAIVGKSTAETQKELCLALDIALKEPEKKFVQKDDSVHLTMTLSKELHDKLMRCKDLASHTLLRQQGDVSMNTLFEFLADEYLEKAEPIKARKDGNILLEKSNSNELDLNDLGSNDTTSSKDKKVTSASVLSRCEAFDVTSTKNKSLKTLTPKTRREIFRRDRCCQYLDKSTGQQCKSTFLLQVDHKTPRWATRWISEDHSTANLQILCAEHNRMKYKKEAGIR